MRQMRMLTRLAIATQSHHADADADRWALLEAGTVEAYRRYLAVVYGFESPVEAALAQTVGFRFQFLLPRLRASLLGADILSLGLSEIEFRELARRLRVAPFRDVPEALGWVYVLERNMMMHDALRQHVADHTPNVLVRAGRYLHAYHRFANERWQELAAVLDQVAINGTIAERITSAAHHAFRCQRDWFASRTVVAWDGPTFDHDDAAQLPAG
jgi:heme oxygenase